MSVNKIFFFSLIFFLLNNLLQADDKIVIIDVNYIFNQSELGKDFNNKIKNESLKISSKITEFQTDIENKKKILLNKKNLLSEKDYNKEYLEIEENVDKYNLIIQRENEELNILKSKIKEDFFKNLLPLLEQYSSNNSINLIIKKESVIMAKNTLDITNEIVKILNDNKK